MPDINLEFIKISAIIPLFNKGKYLQRCLSSILCQTLKQLEVIIVDDKSTDNFTIELLHKIKKVDSRIRIYKLNQNLGTYSARVYGVFLAYGKYISFIDPDDWIAYDLFDYDYKIALSYNADIVKHLAIRQSNSRIITLNNPRYAFYNNTLLKTEFLSNRLEWSLWMKLIKKNIIIKAIKLIGHKMLTIKLTYGEDKLLIGAIFTFANKMVCTKKIGYYYNDNLPESNWKKSAKFKISQLNVVNSCLYQIYKQNISGCINTSIENIKYPLTKL